MLLVLNKCDLIVNENDKTKLQKIKTVEEEKLCDHWKFLYLREKEGKRIIIILFLPKEIYFILSLL
jgi:hypothetical protein